MWQMALQSLELRPFIVSEENRRPPSVLSGQTLS